MATARKAWFRVADSVLHEGWDDKTLASFIRLCAYLNTRWAREGLSAEEAANAEISDQALMLITNTKRTDYARIAASKLALKAGLRLCFGDLKTTLSWPKYAKFQGFPTPKLPPPPPPPPPPPQKKKKEEAKPASRGSRSRSPKAKPVPFPEAGLSLEDTQKLYTWADSKGHSHALVDAKVEAIRDWAEAKGIVRPGWVATIRSAIRQDAADGGKSNGRHARRSSQSSSRNPIRDALEAAAERRGL